MNNELDKYIQLAKEYNITNAKIISVYDIVFDDRAILKCKWGCNDYFSNDPRCHNRNVSLDEKRTIIRSYNKLLIAHAHNDQLLSKAVLAIEREAFLNGNYFASAIRTCHYCDTCSFETTGSCQFPRKVRPCEQSFGIDIYATVRGLGLPCNVLQDKNDVPNLYGFVLIK